MIFNIRVQELSDTEREQEIKENLMVCIIFNKLLYLLIIENN